MDPLFVIKEIKMTFFAESPLFVFNSKLISSETEIIYSSLIFNTILSVF